MLRTTCLISHIILPVYISFGDEGCIKALACYVRSCSCMTDHLVFVFSVRQPPPAINPWNLEASEDKLRLSELSLGKSKRPRLVCANPSPKCASLGWEFGSSCSVGGLWLSWHSIFVASRCLVVGESITCFFLRGHW